MGTFESIKCVTMGSNNGLLGSIVARNAAYTDIPIKCSSLALEREEL
jgi:hypothetical protein